jgi:hypothetical protein
MRKKRQPVRAAFPIIRETTPLALSCPHRERSSASGGDAVSGFDSLTSSRVVRRCVVNRFRSADRRSTMSPSWFAFPTRAKSCFHRGSTPGCSGRAFSMPLSARTKAWQVQIHQRNFFRAGLIFFLATATACGVIPSRALDSVVIHGFPQEIHTFFVRSSLTSHQLVHHARHRIPFHAVPQPP